MEQPNFLADQPSAMQQPTMQTAPMQQSVVHQPVAAPRAPASPIGNPLMKHFRQPAMFIALTSKGRFWADGALELTVNGEIPVYPMTAKDEIILKTPDALINGTSVVHVIQSCCPNIKNAWEMPSIDVDSTLIAIRIASFGSNMAVTAKCPHCEEEHDYEVNLHAVRDQIQTPNYDESINTPDGLQIKLRPLSYAQVSKAGNLALEEDRMIQSLNQEGVDDETKSVEFNKHVRKMIEINIDNATNCTAAIIADGQVVTDPTFIREYYQNAESSILRTMQTKIKEFSDTVSIKPQSTKCTSCDAEFKLNIEFDYSRFFASGF